MGVYKDEWFPVYYLNLTDNNDIRIEVSKSFYKKYAKVMGEFVDCQDTLAKLYDEAIDKMNKKENKNG